MYCLYTTGPKLHVDKCNSTTTSMKVSIKEREPLFHPACNHLDATAALSGSCIVPICPRDEFTHPPQPTTPGKSRKLEPAICRSRRLKSCCSLLPFGTSAGENSSTGGDVIILVILESAFLTFPPSSLLFSWCALERGQKQAAKVSAWGSGQRQAHAPTSLGGRTAGWHALKSLGLRKKRPARESKKARRLGESGTRYCRTNNIHFLLCILATFHFHGNSIIAVRT